MTCFPSMPGRPRSRRMRSGRNAGTTCKASSPEEASWIEYPWASRDARRNRRIPASSSTTITRGPDSLTVRLQWQEEGYFRPSLRTALRQDPAMVRFHESLADRKAETCSFGRSRDADTVEFVKYAFQFLLRNSPPAVEDPDLQLAGIQPGFYVYGRFGWRILERIIEHIHQHLHDQNIVHRNQRQLGGDGD